MTPKKCLIVPSVMFALIACGIAQAQTVGRTAALSEIPVTGSPRYREAVSNFLKGNEPKIVGGKLAAKNAYPWQVSLGVSWIDDPYRAHFCGGTILSENWIVTAAHCLVDTAPKDIIVTAGTNELGVGGVRHNVNRIVVKSNYDPKTSNNDIALIELFKPLTFAAAVKSIPVVGAASETEQMKPGTLATVLGWGYTAEGGSKVRDLRFVDVPVVERVTCNRPLAYDGRVTANMICAGDLVGGKDSCQGDSGGPLTVNTTTGPQLAGIVSWGEGCARPNLVGIYTRAPIYVSWIAACIADPANCK